MGYYYMNENPTVAEYKLDDIEPGLKKNFKVTITESMSNDFARLTGDNSPIHMNEHYARATYFNQRICHGMLLGSFFLSFDRYASTWERRTMPFVFYKTFVTMFSKSRN